MSIYKLYYLNKFEELGLTNEESVYCVDRLQDAIDKENDDCVDNIRIAVDDKNLKEYNEQRLNGCCGFYDKEIILKSGKKVKIGFNYGH